MSLAQYYLQTASEGSPPQENRRGFHKQSIGATEFSGTVFFSDKNADKSGAATNKKRYQDSRKARLSEVPACRICRFFYWPSLKIAPYSLIMTSSFRERFTPSIIYLISSYRTAEATPSSPAFPPPYTHMAHNILAASPSQTHASLI